MYQQMVLCSLLMFSSSVLTSSGDDERTSPFSRPYSTTGKRSRHVNTLVEFVVVD